MALTGGASKALPLHDLTNVNTVLGMLYDENGVYRAAFEPEVFYNTILLDTLKYGEENYVHLKYAENLSIRKGETTAKFRRWAGMTPTLRPLKEGVPPAPDKHAYETIEVGNVFSFGRWSEYTDRIDLSVISEVIAERSLHYGDLANQTKELYARKTWLSAPNEFYANFKGGFEDLGFGDEIVLDDLRFLIQRMKRMLVKPISGKFNYVCSTEFINGLIDDPRVKQYMAIEQTTGALWGSGEPFPMFEIMFIPTMLDEFAYPDTDFPGVFEMADGKEALRLYAVNGTKIYYLDIHEDFVVSSVSGNKVKHTTSGTSYLADGTAVEDHVMWELPIDSDANDGTNGWEASDFQGSGLPTSTLVTLRESDITYSADAYGRQIKSFSAPADGTAGAATVIGLIASGAFTQLPVHRGILFGMEALVKLNQDGISDMPQIIVKPLGSSGVADPINQRQSIGFKVDGFGLAIKRPEAICITYGIPKYAELAALTDKFLEGNWELMDGLIDDDSVANTISAVDGSGILRVDGVNLGGYPGSANVGGGDYAPFSATTAYPVGATVTYNDVQYVFIADHLGAWDAGDVAEVKNTLEENVLDNGGNDPDSNVR